MAGHTAPLSIGEAPSLTTAETTAMVVTVSCETPAMEGEEAASSVTEVKTATTSSVDQWKYEEIVVDCKET
jgi:hypothetical protein